MTLALADKVTHTLHAVEAFSLLLEQETAALKAADFAAFESLQDEKLTRAQDYQDAVLTFEEDIDLLKTMDDTLKEKLRAAHTRFSTAADDNQTTLQASRNTSERIVTLIMDAARQSVSEGPNYGANATQELSDKIPVHFKINEVL